MLTAEYDVIIVGGGLQGGLIAMALLERWPEVRLVVIERASHFGGNHTWCLHPEDAPAAAKRLLEPLVVYRWPGYDVRFPGLLRRLAGPYAAVTSTRLHEVLCSRLAASQHATAYLDRSVTQLRADEVVLDNGQCLRAKWVVDAQGPTASAAAGACGYQKFVGLELELERPHGLRVPRLMDMLAEQGDGFHFMYVLPFSERRLLIEDTTFSRSPELAAEQCEQQAWSYLRSNFVADARLVRREQGVLPMTWSAHGSPPEVGRPLVVGYRGGYFHPATGYSFPVALGVALSLSQGLKDGSPVAALAVQWQHHRRQARLAEALNWLAFHAFAPEEMWHVFERFYHLPEPLIHRFYALRGTPADWLRIVVGRPPRGFSLRAVRQARGRA